MKLTNSNVYTYVYFFAINQPVAFNTSILWNLKIVQSIPLSTQNTKFIFVSVITYTKHNFREYISVVSN